VEAAERETTIQWSEADGGTAAVFTAQRATVTRLRRLQGARRVDVQRTNGGLWLGETWEVPIACVVLRNPPRLSEAQRRALRERGRQSPVARRTACVGQNCRPRPRNSELQGTEGIPTSPLTVRQNAEQEGDTGTDASEPALSAGEIEQ
jgi:hypothetical protein